MGLGETSRLDRGVWPSFLRGDGPQWIVERLNNGDPLRLREGAARRLRELWILLDPDRVFQRAIGVCATAAPREDPPADLAQWAREKLDLAIEQLVCRDREAEKTHPETLSAEETDFPLLTESLMLEPEQVRPASVAFNSLDPLPRRAFFELMIEGREVVDCIESGPWNEDGLYQAIQAALAVFSLDGQAKDADDRAQGRSR